MCEHFSRVYSEKPHNQALVPTQKAGRYSSPFKNLTEKDYTIVIMISGIQTSQLLTPET